jgi:pyruvate/2-oxoglutarate dehydrogenase complex dihydrolipoamide dehydrogenase (E3) component
MTTPEIQPRDAANETLIANVHPPDWTNPTPVGRYNLVVIGAGSAGLISAAIAAGLGAKVALIERHLLGGDCLNVGCVPSKALIRASRMVAETRRAAAELGLPEPDSNQIDFGAAMERMRRIRARISAVDSALRYRDELGVDVFLGDARFEGRDSVHVGDQLLHFRKAVIATGARPVAPPIDGLAEAGYRSNETIFELTERPRRLGVIGSGPIGCELAQAFARLGCDVTIFDVAAQVLQREDPEAAGIIQQRLADEGIRLVLGCSLERVETTNGVRCITGSDADGASLSVDVDELLVATGRAPNVDGLGLDAAGVESDPRRGVHVNDYLQTSNRTIFAAGDVCMDWKFTHAADAAAKIVVQNALFLRTAKLSSLVMPWCTYTDPEVAHVGLYEHEALERGIETDQYTMPLSENDRAIADGEEEGFVKILVKRGGDEILGATLVASHAGEIVSELTLAMVNKVGLGKFLNVIHPYPTQAEAIKRAAGAYTRTRMTPTMHRLLSRFMAFRR